MTGEHTSIGVLGGGSAAVGRARRSWRAVALLGLLGLLGLAACGGATDAPTKPPNIVLIISDDHDYEHLGFAGYPGLTPAIDSLAADGVTFPVAYAAPRCRPALGGLLTGREPHASGLYYNAGPPRALGPNVLPRLLLEAGYTTYAEGKFWEGHPRELGFEHAPEPEANEVGGVQTASFVRAGQAALFAFLDGVGQQPFFIWWAPMLPHLPHDPPAELARRFPPASIEVPAWIAPAAADEYRRREAKSLAMVAWLDRGVGQLFAALRERDLERDTLVIFLIDNGWANGHVSKGSPYEKGVRTPIVLRWPGQIEGGALRSSLASTLDVMPTILDYAGVAVPMECQGQSLRPWIEDADASGRALLAGAAYPVRPGPELAAERDAFALYARDERWKYVRWLRDVRAADNERIWRIKHWCVPLLEHLAGDEELFDLAVDPYEQRNLAGDPLHADILRGLRASALTWWRDTGGKDFPR